MTNWFIRLTPLLLVDLIKKKKDYAAKEKKSNINVLFKKQFMMQKIQTLR